MLPLIAVLYFLIGSCSSSKPVQSTQIGRDYCAPSAPNLESMPEEFQLLGAESYAKDTLFNRHFELHEYLVACATGSLYHIHQLLDQKQDTSVTGRLSRLESIADVQIQISRFRTELDGISAELDCQGERADQLATYLDEIDQRRSDRFTVSSVIIGSVTTVVAALMTSGSAEDITSVAGGLVAAGIGAMTIRPKGKKMVIKHERNLLKEIWNKPEKSADFPSSIWYVLNKEGFSNLKGSTLAESITNRWKSFEIEQSSSEAEIELLFGQGGLYTADLLKKREAMLNQLQSSIRGINQDLDRFMDQLSDKLY